MIPKIIHYCWFGNGKLPERDKMCIESWKKHCPDYKIIRWDESNYDINKNKYMKEAYEERKYGFVPDYARLDIVYNYGGIYLDTDVELIRSLDFLLELKGFAGFEAIDTAHKYVALGLGFGAEQKNDIIKKMRDDYNDKSFKIKQGVLNLTPSPSYSTEVLIKLGLKPTGTTQQIDGFTFFSEEYFCPLSCVTDSLNITEYTISIHHYNASWLTDNEKKRIVFVNKYKKLFGKTMGYYVGTLAYYIKVEGLSVLIVKKIK